MAPLTRLHHRRLREIYRSAGWPCCDAIEIELLAAGLCGAAEVAARFWLGGGRRVPKEEAEALLSALSWRGISSFPLQDQPPAKPQRTPEIG